MALPTVVLFDQSGIHKEPVRKKLRITRILANGFAPICAFRRFLFRILIDHDKRCLNAYGLT